MDSFNNGQLGPGDQVPESDAATRGRDSLFLASKARIAGASAIEVRVRNLSEGGLMVELDRPLAPGTAIEIEVRGIGWIPGSIAWFAEGRAGVAFDLPIDPKRARKPVGKGPSTPYYAKSLTSRHK